MSSAFLLRRKLVARIGGDYYCKIESIHVARVPARLLYQCGEIRVNLEGMDVLVIDFFS